MNISQLVQIFGTLSFLLRKNEEEAHVPRKSGTTRKNVAEKIKEDILYFAAKDVKDKFFEVFRDLL